MYWILNIQTYKSYIGKRQTTKTNPYKDIGVTYFSSSSDKEFIKDQKQHPENYRYFVLSIFDNGNDSSKEEKRLHKIFNVDVDPAFYNITKANEYWLRLKGNKHPLYNKKIYFNPITRKHKWFSDSDQIEEGFQLGISKEAIEKKSTTMSGKMRKENHPNYNKKYYHDPETNKGGFFLENEAPENYVLGNTKETIELKSLKAKNKVLKDSTKMLLSKIKKNIFLMIKGELKEKVNKDNQLNYLLDGWEYSSHTKNFIWMQRNTDNRVLKIPIYLKDDLTGNRQEIPILLRVGMN